MSNVAGVQPWAVRIDALPAIFTICPHGAEQNSREASYSPHVIELWITWKGGPRITSKRAVGEEQGRTKRTGRTLARAPCQSRGIRSRAGEQIAHCALRDRKVSCDSNRTPRWRHVTAEQSPGASVLHVTRPGAVRCYLDSTGVSFRVCV